MQRLPATCLVLACLVALRPAPAGAEVTIQQAADKSVAVTTSVYTAQFDARGNLTELLVKGARALTHQFGFGFGVPGKPPTEAPSINVTANLVAVRSGKLRVEWTFGEDTIHFLTEGFEFEFKYDPSIKMVIGPGGTGGPPDKYGGGCIAIVLSNNLTIASQTYMHVSAGRYLPSGYCNGSVKIGALFENELRLGAPADAVQLLTGIAIVPVGSGYGNLNEGGNGGYGLVHFPDPNAIQFKITQKNVGQEPFALEYRAAVADHYVAAKEAARLDRKMTIEGGTTAEVSWPVPALPPGFYYLTVSAWRGDTKLTETKQTFTVDLAHYTHALTRPPDFKEFWNAKVAEMRAIPFDAKLTEAPEKSTAAAIYYDLELTHAGGKRLKTVLQTPRQPGKYMGKYGGGEKATDANAVLLAMPIEPVEGMGFSRWVSRDDNNMLVSYLYALRLTDYLRSRPDVDRIYLFGASRSGPVQFVNAALDPTRIAGLDIHVPTSTGIGWTDKPYSGWGQPGGGWNHHEFYQPTNPQHVAEFTALAAYFDPVNFAPDMTVPWVTAYGVDDNLSPPQGTEAMFHLSPAKWKRISRDAGAHQYSGGFQKLEKDLATYLQTAATSGTDEKIMKEH